MFQNIPSLRALFSRAPAPASVDSHAETSLLVESLEPRLVPSASVATGDFDRDGLEDLTIKVRDSNQSVTITADDLGGTTTVAIDGNGDGRFDAAGDFFQVFNGIFGGVKVKVQGDFNRVDYLLASDLTNVFQDLKFKLASTVGSTVNFDSQGFGLLAGTDAQLRVNGGGGSNTVNVDLDALDDVDLVLGIAPSGPANLVNINFFGAIQNDALVEANVLVGPGDNARDNAINVNVLGALRDAELDVIVIGSDDADAGRDVVNFRLAGAVTDGALLDVSMLLADGRDEGRVELAQGGFTVRNGSSAFITLDGGQRGDALSVNSDGLAGTLLIDNTSILDIDIAGGNGEDTITSDFSNVDALRLNGELILLATGGFGDDRIDVGLANTNDSTGLYDVTLRGEEDDDTFSVFIDDPSNGRVDYDSTDLSYPTGFAIVAGGSGFNVADVFGNVALFNIDRA